jgi:hypothetical protein
VAPIDSAEPLADTEVAGIRMAAGTKPLLLTPGPASATSPAKSDGVGQAGSD